MPEIALENDAECPLDFNPLNALTLAYLHLQSIAKCTERVF